MTLSSILPYDVIVLHGNDYPNCKQFLKWVEINYLFIYLSYILYSCMSHDQASIEQHSKPFISIDFLLKVVTLVTFQIILAACPRSTSPPVYHLRLSSLYQPHQCTSSHSHHYQPHQCTSLTFSSLLLGT